MQMSLIQVQAERSDAKDALEGRSYFVQKGSQKIPVTLKERVGLKFPESLDTNLLSQFAEQHKPNGATHFRGFTMTDNGGQPTYHVLIYYRA